MTEIIPGGRPRASSEGDIFDDYGQEKLNSPPLSHYHREVSKSSHLSSKGGKPVELEVERCEELPQKQKRRSRPSFKRLQVKNWMQRLINGSSNSEKESSSGGKGGWVPNEKQNNTQHDKSTSKKDYSYTQPLVTKPVVKPTPWDITPGTTGIQNHGNTCFMNAVLQCLNNSDCFSEYFITRKYKEDLHNKGFSKKFTGSKADVTEQLAQLLESLWSNRYTPELSSLFKSIIGKHNGQYKGSSQHDSQEFLLWLLDHINEDLLVSSKKKKNVVKWQGYTDEEAALEILMSCNGCSVYNLFQALYRSSLKCPNCSKQSNTFETYLCLSLPLPHHITRPVYVTIVQPDNTPRQFKIGLRLNVHDAVIDLREKISEETRIPGSNLVLCQIYDDGFRNTYGDEEPLTNIPEFETVYAIEMLPASSPIQSHPSPEFESTCVQIIITHIERHSNPSKCYRFCSPQVLKISRDIDFKELQKTILLDMKDCVEEGLLAQKLDILFKLRVVDGSPGKSYLPSDVDMPLFTQNVDRALCTYDRKYGPQHIKLVAEWEPHVRDRVIVYDDIEVEELVSVKEVRRQLPVQVSLDECFKLFTREETLTGDDAWLCPHCGQQQQGTTKTLGLWSLPDVLVIHLKRFRQRAKLNTLIDFPVNGLNMKKYILKDGGSECQNRCFSFSSRVQRLHRQSDSDQFVYDLYGVCNHFGNMNGGHYTAFCKNPLDSRWYEFDDSRVKRIAEAEVKTSSAYLLFYQRRGLSAVISDELKSGTHWIYNLYPISTSSGNSSRQGMSNGYGTREENYENKSKVKQRDGVDAYRNDGGHGQHSRHDEVDAHRNSGSHEQYSRQASYGYAVKEGNVQSNGGDYLSKYADERDLKVKLPDESRHTRRHTTDVHYGVSKDQQKFSSTHGQKTTIPENIRKGVDHVSRNRENEFRHSSNVPATKNQNNSAVAPADTERPPPASYNTPQQSHTAGYNTPQQSRRQVSCSASGPAKQAWLTPQPTRKHISDDYTPPAPKQFVRQLSMPSKSPNKEDDRWRSSPPKSQEDDRWRSSPPKSQSRTTSDRSPSVHPQELKRDDRVYEDDSRYGRDVRNPNLKESDRKFATIARINQRKPVEQTQKDYYNMPRSKTDNSIASNNRGSFSNKRDEGHSFEPTRVKDNSMPPSSQKPPVQPPNQNRMVRKTSGTDSSHVNRKLDYNMENLTAPPSDSRRTSPSNMTNYVSNGIYSNGDRGQMNPYEVKQTIRESVPSRNLQYPVSDIVSQGVATTPSLNEARSRKPFVDSGNGDTNSYTEGYQRYRPHRHFYTDYQNKDQKKYFKKEKMYSPCLKESSV